MKKTTFYLFLLLLLGITAGRAYAQANLGRVLLKGEGQARAVLVLSQAKAAANKQHLKTTAAGARLQPGQANGMLTLQPVELALTNPRPFIAVAPIWHGQQLHAATLAVEVRHSADGRSWSAWEKTGFDGHADDDATRRVGRAQQLDVSTRFVQFRVGISAANAVLSRLEVLSYSPGETPGVGPNGSVPAAEEASRTTAVCAKPGVTSRAGWGARTPVGSRTYTTVTHLIVHHEFGSNTSSDWAARVRAVEALHIDTNGWSDVGYNYLIDPNGVIYEGRSGGDNVVGAHFCGGNTNTMAVCMLGTYTSVAPTAAARASLKKILGWKASKEGINPTGSSTHYAAGFIPNVCGHRDNRGCTECPGNTLYAQLPSLRTEIQSYISSCGTPPPTADVTAPTTSISAPAGTVGNDFTATFTDGDNVGVTERFYQVLESSNGTEWRANRGNGYFNDNFVTSAINPEWTVQTGTWAVTADGRLKQSNTALTNTNLSTVLTQGSGQSYLYQFAGKLNSTAGARRFGLHLFADNVAATERNNSYLVWFSADDQKVRIIETTNNVLTERAVGDAAITAGAWADYKASYNATSGVLNVYVNSDLKLTWTDTTPLASGAGISLRTNQADVEFDDVKVYKSRSTTKLVTVGPESNQDARRQSPNSATPACKIKSLVRDAAHNWSAVGNLDLVVTFPVARMATLAGQTFGTNVAPNPVLDASTRIEYFLDQAQDMTLTLLDLRGQTVQVLHRGPQGAGRHELTLAAHKLLPGVYLLRVQGAHGKAELLRVLKQ